MSDGLLVNIVRFRLVKFYGYSSFALSANLRLRSTIGIKLAVTRLIETHKQND